MIFPKPKATKCNIMIKCNNRQRRYSSTDEFMKLMPEETSTEQAVKLLKSKLIYTTTHFTYKTDLLNYGDQQQKKLLYYEHF